MGLCCDLLSRKPGSLASPRHEFAKCLPRRVFRFDSESKLLLRHIARNAANEILLRDPCSVLRDTYSLRQIIGHAIMVAQTNYIVCDFEIARRVFGESI